MTQFYQGGMPGVGVEKEQFPLARTERKRMRCCEELNETMRIAGTFLVRTSILSHTLTCNWVLSKSQPVKTAPVDTLLLARSNCLNPQMATYTKDVGYSPPCKAFLWRQALPCSIQRYQSGDNGSLGSISSAAEAESPFVFRLSEVHEKHKGWEQP